MIVAGHLMLPLSQPCHNPLWTLVFSAMKTRNPQLFVTVDF